MLMEDAKVNQGRRDMVRLIESCQSGANGDWQPLRSTLDTLKGERLGIVAVECALMVIALVEDDAERMGTDADELLTSLLVGIVKEGER